MASKPNAPRKALSGLEHQLMEILWKGGPATAEGIREALAPKHALKDSSVRTILSRLEEKGYVKHTQHGKAFMYTGVEQRQNVAVRAVRQILDRFCDGSVEQLLLGLVENEVVDKAELEELVRKIGKTKSGKTGK